MSERDIIEAAKVCCDHGDDCWKCPNATDNAACNAAIAARNAYESHFDPEYVGLMEAIVQRVIDGVSIEYQHDDGDWDSEYHCPLCLAAFTHTTINGIKQFNHERGCPVPALTTYREGER